MLARPLAAPLAKPLALPLTGAGGGSLDIRAGFTYADDLGELCDIATLTDAYSVVVNAVHPSVWYFPTAWNGYKWWMVHSPVRSGNDGGGVPYFKHENPWIVVSTNGKDWVTPPGGTNPVSPLQSGDVHNADPNLFYDSVSGIMYVFWTVSATPQRIEYKTSTNGVTWSERATVMSNVPANATYVSPAFIRRADGTWMVWFSKTATDLDPNLYLWTAPTLDGLNNAAVRTESVCTFTPAASFTRHHEVRFYNGKYYLLNAIRDLLADTVQNYLLLHESTDGINWTVPVNREFAIGWDGESTASHGGYYKSSMFFHHDFSVGNPSRVGKLWHGRNDFSKIRVSDMETDPATQLAADYLESGIELAAANVATYAVGDRFVRTNGTIVGTAATSGDTWLTAGSPEMQISSNAMYGGTGTAGRCTIAVGSADMEMTVRFSALARKNSVFELELKGNRTASTSRIGLFKGAAAPLIGVRSYGTEGTVNYAVWNLPQIGPESGSDYRCDGIEFTLRVVGNVFTVWQNGRKCAQVTLSAQLMTDLTGFTRAAILMREDARIDRLLIRAL